MNNVKGWRILVYFFTIFISGENASKMEKEVKGVAQSTNSWRDLRKGFSNFVTFSMHVHCAVFPIH